MCEVIVDGRSSENIMSKTLVKAMQLPIIKQLNPYSIGWIKKKECEIKDTKMYIVPFCIGKHYADEIDLDLDAL